MKKSFVFVLVNLFLAVALAQAKQPVSSLPKVSPDNLPEQWRGFNLLEKFMVYNNSPYQEQDFKLIHDLGFNFVRLPMDYRCWIVEGDWTRFNESVLKEIDQAVQWGQKYNVHVCLNFHRAPGYTVANPPEKRSLWTDDEVQSVCANHWRLFAKRYKGIPSRNLSFNLMNEPADVDPKIYVRVVTKLVAAIRDEDPDRLIISDGLQWGKLPLKEIADMKIAQATRGYYPMELTHYKASWVNSTNWPEPHWPIPLGWNGYLYGHYKGDMQKPLELSADLDQPATLVLAVGSVSTLATLHITDGDKVLVDHKFEPGPGQGPWKNSTYQEEYKNYLGQYDKEFRVKLLKGKHDINVLNSQGDWMTLSDAWIESAGKRYSIPLKMEWGGTAFPIQFTSGNAVTCKTISGQQYLKDNGFSVWAKFKNRPAGVMVGEWGVFNQTPHPVALRWMEDNLKNFKEAHIGWALWNFRGAFGVLDSGRSDVDYEDFHGHKLDRKMLELLQKY